MSFEFLGTFNRSQYERFVAFARAQRGVVDARIAHLKAEADRIGVLTFGYNPDGSPFGLATDPITYIGKLLTVYEILGGDPQRDLQVRLKTQPVYVLKGDYSTTPQQLSSGDALGGKGMADADSAVLMQEAKAWLGEVFVYRRDALERKIRRALDYADELQREITVLQGIVQAATEEGSLENIFQQLSQMIADPMYRAVYDDQGKDVDGRLSHAPLSSYEIGAGRVGSSIQRGEGGITVPGEKKA